MRRDRQRRTSKAARLPPAHTLARRLVELRTLLADDPPAAGDQALKLLEEHLEQLAQAYGYEGEGSLRRYSSFLRGHGALDEALAQRIDTYTDARNAIAHTYGLQTTPALAAELVDFLAELLAGGGPTAELLMTRALRTVAQGVSLASARDLMLAGGYGRLPVVGAGGRVVGLLTERDVVAAQAQADQAARPLASLTVAEALPPDPLGAVAFVAPGAAREEVLAALRRPGVAACLVTPDGRADESPLGIITHADLLYRLADTG